MKSLLRYWYLPVFALVISAACAVGFILLRKDAWMPQALPEVAPPEDGLSSSFREWTFSAAELEDLQVKLEAERAGLRQRESELESLEAQVQAEQTDLVILRDELVELREQINQDYIVIEENERSNLRDLAAMYAEMKAPAAVKVFNEMELDSVVKILTLMPADAAARVLGTMAESPDENILAQAAKISEAIRKVKE